MQLKPIMHLDVKERLQVSYTLYKYYKNLIESYVSDYYVENHWNKLPNSWQNILEHFTTDQIAELLDYKKPFTKGVLPLSLLCVRTVIKRVILPRDSMTLNIPPSDKAFLKYFRKSIKLKKRHEIEKMAKVCYDTAVTSNCFYIVDIGSGLGHLSRMLSYRYGLKVCTFEANAVLSKLAEEMDEKFDMILKCKSVAHQNTSQTVHINKRIEFDMDWESFLKIVANAFNEKCCTFRFGIVGLHPCGNLGSTLLRLYNECPNVAFINMASCCYMKLTLDSTKFAGFPLSDFCKNKNFNLTYLACEIACHAIENYVEKLRRPNDHLTLKIHAYRAQLEQILVSVDSNLKHSAVCSVKFDENLSFRKYCDKIFSRLSVSPSDTLVSVSEELINDTWKKVVIFYSVRLMFAPLIESVILYDRLLFTKYLNSNCKIVPLFDCNISPRNHVLSAIKNI